MFNYPTEHCDGLATAFRLGISTIFCLCLSARAGGPALALEPDQVFAKASPSVVVVLAYDAADQKKGRSGSGVIIAPGQIITNCHVVTGAEVIYLKRDKFKTLGTLRLADADRDLCQIEATDKKGFENVATIILTTDSLHVGQKVYAIGAPAGLELTFSDGLISSLRADPAIGISIQTNAPISKGSSGGGLFDSNGHLIGITTWQVVAGQNLNFAVPAPLVYELSARGQLQAQEFQDPMPVRQQTVKDITAWATALAARDVNYRIKQAKLAPKVASIFKRYPAKYWLLVLQDLYDAIEIPVPLSDCESN